MCSRHSTAYCESDFAKERKKHWIGVQQLYIYIRVSVCTVLLVQIYNMVRLDLLVFIDVE